MLLLVVDLTSLGSSESLDGRNCLRGQTGPVHMSVGDYQLVNLWKRSQLTLGGPTPWQMIPGLCKKLANHDPVS